METSNEGRRKRLRLESKPQETSENLHSERVELNLNINSHSYKLRSKDPPVLEDDASVNPIQIQQLGPYVNANLCKIKIESDYVPIVAIKQESDDDPDLDQQVDENNVLTMRDNSTEKSTEKERVAKLEERINSLSREQTEIQTSLQNKIDDLTLLNDQKQTTINALNSTVTQQWTEINQLKAQVAEQQNQIEMNNKLKSGAQNQQCPQANDLNSPVTLQRDSSNQEEAQVTEQIKPVEFINSKLKLNDANQQSDENSDPQVQVQMCGFPTKFLQSVLTKLNVPNLRTARLVNKMWKKEADTEITRRGCFRLKFEPKTRPFDKGLKELEFSTNLPCSDFHLSLSEENDELEGIENFISLFGSQVKSLTLNSPLHGKPLSTLLVGLPNLENLFVNWEFYMWENFVRNQNAPKLTLPKDCFSHLKHITYTGDVERRDFGTLLIYAGTRIFEIIDNAPNLQSINNAVFDSDLLLDASSIWIGKVQLLKAFAYFDDRHNTHANSGIKIETLIMRFDSCQQEAVRRIVESSQDTLNTLLTISTFICLPQETGFGPLFLPFQNLKVVQIRIDELMWNNLCRNNFASKHLQQFRQKAFPNLTTVILEVPDSYYAKEPTVERNYFPFTNSIKSVNNLELRGQRDYNYGRSHWEVDEHRMRRLKELFPNVRHLKLNDSPQIPQILPLCFSHWPGLESLQIHVNFKRVCDMDKVVRAYFEAMQVYDNLDPVFTGLPLEICERLERQEEEIKAQDIQVAQDINSEERSRNSLVSLTELKKLTIVFSDIRPKIFRAKCPISSVSCLYAFKLMSNLKVRVLYDQNLAVFSPKMRKFNDQYNMEKYLEELSPYCEFGHWENNGLASSIPAKNPLPRMALSVRMPTYYV